MSVAVKTREQVEQVITSIQDGIANLPDYDVFGEPNEEAEQESQDWIEELQTYLDNGVMVDQDSEVGQWLCGKPSSVSDYD